jgi:hypothetical protein
MSNRQNSQQSKCKSSVFWKAEHISSLSMLMMLIHWAKTNTMQKNKEVLSEASNEVGLEVNREN